MYSIVTTNRIVTRDVEFAGCPMKAGDRVLLSIPAADRDPLAVPRRRPRSTSTGRATATSPSPPVRTAASARTSPASSSAVAVEEWHRRIPEYRVADGADVQFHVGGVAGVDNLPLVWDVD